MTTIEELKSKIGYLSNVYSDYRKAERRYFRNTRKIGEILRICGTIENYVKVIGTPDADHVLVEYVKVSGTNTRKIGDQKRIHRRCLSSRPYHYNNKKYMQKKFKLDQNQNA